MDWTTLDQDKLDAIYNGAKQEILRRRDLEKSLKRAQIAVGDEVILRDMGNGKASHLEGTTAKVLKKNPKTIKVHSFDNVIWTMDYKFVHAKNDQKRDELDEMIDCLM